MEFHRTSNHPTPDLFIRAVQVNNTSLVRNLLTQMEVPERAMLYMQDTRMCKLLVEAGGNPNARYGDMTTMGRAVAMDDREMVEVLLQWGAYPEGLQQAWDHGDMVLVERLLKAGAPIDDLQPRLVHLARLLQHYNKI